MKKVIVIEKQNGKKIAFIRQSDTMVLILKVLAVLNIAACVFSIFNKHYIVALLDLIVSFFTYAISTYVERNNEVFDFFEDSENNLNQ